MQLGALNRTANEKETYWHVKVRRHADCLHLIIPGKDDLDITRRSHDVFELQEEGE